MKLLLTIFTAVFAISATVPAVAAESMEMIPAPAITPAPSGDKAKKVKTAKKAKKHKARKVRNSAAK